MNTVESKYFLITPYETGIEVIMKKSSVKRMIISYIAVWIVVGAPALAFSILAFAQSEWAHAILFLFFSTSLLLVFAIYTWKNLLEERTFQLKLNEQGVFFKEANKSFLFTWCEVISYGMVDKNKNGGSIRESSNGTQMCLYFSKRLHTELDIRKKLCHIGPNTFRHGSTDDMIVLAFGEDDIENFIREHFYKYISMYCAEGEERSFIENQPE